MKNLDLATLIKFSDISKAMWKTRRLTYIFLTVILETHLVQSSSMKFITDSVLKEEFLSEFTLNDANMCSCRIFCFAWPNCSALSILNKGKGNFKCLFSNKPDISYENFTELEESYSWFKSGFDKESSVSFTTEATTTAVSRPNVVASETTEAESTSTSQPLDDKFKTIKKETTTLVTTLTNSIKVEGMEACDVALVDGCLFQGVVSSYWNSGLSCQNGGGELFVAKNQREFVELQEFLKYHIETNTQIFRTMLVGINDRIWTNGANISFAPLETDWATSDVLYLPKGCAVVGYISGKISLDAVDCGVEYPPLCRMGTLIY